MTSNPVLIQIHNIDWEDILIINDVNYNLTCFIEHSWHLMHFGHYYIIIHCWKKGKNKLLHDLHLQIY